MGSQTNAGNVGSEVTAQLLARGERVRVFTRDATKVAHWGDRVQVALGDFGKPDTLARAAAGVKGVFLMNGGPDGEPFRQLLAGVKAQGEPRMVFLSTILAGSPEFAIGKMHKDKEDAIQEAGLQGTFVRAGGFMSNAYQWSGTIKAEGVVYNALGSGKSAPIAAEDIAAVAVRELTAPDVADDVFEVTGAKLLSVPEQVGILSKVLGKPIRCVDVPVEAAVQDFIRGGVPEQVAASVGQSFAAIRDGRGAAVTDTVERVTGKRPMTFEEWARKHASRFAA